MSSRKFVWDPEHWRFRAEETRTVADQMTHEQARTIMRRIANVSLSLLKSNLPVRKERKLAIDGGPARSPYSNFANNLFAAACDNQRPIISFGNRHLGAFGKFALIQISKASTHTGMDWRSPRFDND
jgi:hypothetical protein